MNYIKKIDILPPKREKIKEYLLTELKNQHNWKENRTNNIQEQANFFETYLSKGKEDEKEICKPEKELISNLLKEADKAHLQSFNYHLNNKMRFIETKTYNCDDNLVENEYLVFLFDNDDCLIASSSSSFSSFFLIKLALFNNSS